MTELTPEKLKAIRRQLDTAPKIQEDLKAKFGYGENKFFDLDLIEYRIKNKLEDIAEDLDVRNRYGLINDLPRETVGRAFRGHHNEEFMPDYQFNGLLGKITNDIIEGQRKSKGGRKAYELGEGIHAQTPEERSEYSRIGYANGLANLTFEERSEYSRKGGQATIETHGEQMRKGGLIGGLIGGRNKRGRGYWQTHPELLEDICELKYEQGLTWKDTTDEFNRRHGTDYNLDLLRVSYQNNKHLLSDEEE